MVCTKEGSKMTKTQALSLAMYKYLMYRLFTAAHPIATTAPHPLTPHAPHFLSIKKIERV